VGRKALGSALTFVFVASQVYFMRAHMLGLDDDADKEGAGKHGE